MLELALINADCLYHHLNDHVYIVVTETAINGHTNLYLKKTHRPKNCENFSNNQCPHRRAPSPNKASSNGTSSPRTEHTHHRIHPVHSPTAHPILVPFNRLNFPAEVKKNMAARHQGKKCKIYGPPIRDTMRARG